MADSWNIFKREYKWAVEGWITEPDCPEFTNCVRTEFGKKLVKKRFEKQGLNVEINTIENMKGLNPYYEKWL